MKEMAKNIYQRSFVRFLAVGVVNLGVTYGTYLVAWYALGDYKIAFWICVVVGLIFMSVANIRHTFLRRLTLVSGLVYGGYYYGYALVNLVAIGHLIETWNVAEELAPLLTLVVLTPVHYFLSKFLIHKLTEGRA